MKVYLRTIFTHSDEEIFIASQIHELFAVVDKFIVVEPGFTHNGDKRKKIGDSGLKRLLGDKYNKVDYIYIDQHKKIQYANDSKTPFLNEKITRNLFYENYTFSNRDIVISTDADEVLYQDYIVRKINYLNSIFKLFSAITIPCYQFMFNDGLIAPGHIFYGPCIQNVFRKKIGIPTKWRNDGLADSGYGGCHFSWCLGSNAIEEKLNNWAHGIEYGVKDADGRNILKKILSENNYYIRNPNIKLQESKNKERIWPNGYHHVRGLMGLKLNEHVGTNLEDIQ